MRAALPLAALLLAACASPALAAPPKQIVDATTAKVVAAATEGMTPEEANNPEMVPAWMKKVPAKMFKKVDVNGDKIPDWLVSYENAPNPSFFCGSGGCQYELWVGEQGGTWRKVYARGGSEPRITGPKTARRFEVNFHGSVCGSYGASECLRAYRWDSTLNRLVEAPDSKGRTRLVYGSLPPMDLPLDAAPPKVREAIQVRQAYCRDKGGAYPAEEAAIYDIPDIDGDGRRDWLVGSSYDSCRFEDNAPETPIELGIQVFASRGDDAVLVLEDKEGAWEIDLGTPNTFYLIEVSDSCSEDKPCPRKALKWNAEAGKLQ